MTPRGALKNVLERTGYLHDGRPAAGVLLAEDLQADPAQIDRRSRYDAVIREDKVGASAVYEVAGSACIYFAALTDAPDPADLARRHQLAWNHGLAPMLWVITPTQVILYDCFSRPTREPDAKRHVIKIFENTVEGLRALNELAGREQLETGRFWTAQPAKRIDRRHRVDAMLLRDLGATVRLLVAAGLPVEQSHALLGRSIYVAYLIGRRILRPEFLNTLLGTSDGVEIFGNRHATYRLFEWVEKTFNGDLFPLVDRDSGVDERDMVDAAQVEIVRRFLAGESPDSGQLALWPYRFDVIPVELLSSIYENFAHWADRPTAASLGTHYTPLNLVDLVLTQALDGLGGDAKVLDLACGSGAFLVETFRRLVARRVQAGTPADRALIRSVLYEQIYGVDVNAGAVRIAAFSLYLAALELDDAPEPPEALRFERLIGRNLFVADAFDQGAAFARTRPFVEKQFSVIVGNPPWTRSALSASGREYCEARRLPLARRTPDQAFLWRFGDFANESTRIAVVMSAKPFFAFTDAALETKGDLLRRYTPRLLLDLSELRQGLFPSATAPAVVFIADARPADPAVEFTFVALEQSEAFRRHGIMEIAPERVQRLRVGDVITDPSLLKVAKWAGGRDAALIRRIRTLFSSFAHWERKLGLHAGQGFQRASGAKRTPMELQQLRLLSAEEFAPFRTRRLLAHASVPRYLHRVRDLGIYRGPVVVTRRFPKHDQWCRFAGAVVSRDVAYDEKFFGVSFADVTGDQLELAHFFSGIFNSSLATYVLFLTSGVWGVERDEVRAQDIRALPIPSPFEHRAAAMRVSRVAREAYAQGIDAQEDTSLRRALDDAVFALYGLSDADRVLVRDFVDLTVQVKMRGHAAAARAASRPTARQLDSYARRLTATLAPMLDALGERQIRAEIFPLSDSPLHAVYLHYEDRSRGGAAPVHLTIRHDAARLEELSGALADLLAQPIGDVAYARCTLRAYADAAVVIAKPAQRRYWTEAAALQDADAILAEDLRL